MNIPKQRLLTASVLGLALFASSCGADQGAVDTTSPASDTTAGTDGGADTTAPGSALAGGEVFVTGRAKDLLIVGGVNVYPHDVEEALAGVDGVVAGRVAVFGIDDEALGTQRVVVMAETERAADRKSTRLNSSH